MQKKKMNHKDAGFVDIAISGICSIANSLNANDTSLKQVAV